jgi:hypothetical protein
MAPNLWCDHLLLAALVSLGNLDASVLKSLNLSRRWPRVLARLLQFPSPPKTAHFFPEAPPYMAISNAVAKKPSFYFIKNQSPTTFPSSRVLTINPDPLPTMTNSE